MLIRSVLLDLLDWLDKSSRKVANKKHYRTRHVVSFQLQVTSGSKLSTGHALALTVNRKSLKQQALGACPWVKHVLNLS